MIRIAPQFKTNQGFTLIELLVVILIISILSSILFPVFARARENARRVSCASNLKQMGIGLMMYVQDYDERFPKANNHTAQTPPNGYFWVSADNWGTPYWVWQQTIMSYTHDFRIAECPSASYRPANNSGPIPAKGSYGGNRLILPTDQKNVVLPGFPSAALQAPASTYLAMDSGSYTLGPIGSSSVTSPGGSWWYLPGTGPGTPANLSASFSSTIQSDFESGRHFGGVNVMFADGHVKWLKSQTVYREALLCSDCTAVIPVANSAWNPYNP